MQNSDTQKKYSEYMSTIPVIRMNYSPVDNYIVNWNAKHVIKYTTNTIGAGIKAKTDIKQGSIAIYFHGPILPGEFIKNFDLALQLDVNMFMDSAGDIDDFVNHSCSPNTILVCKYHTKYKTFLWCLVAIKDINPEEPITFDYSVSMSGGVWTMSCNCGSSNCRGVLKDFIDLDKSLQSELMRLRSIYSGIIE